MSQYDISTLKQLRQILPLNEKIKVALKTQRYPTIDKREQVFIEDSPLVFFATANREGHVDVSPRGGTPGFVKCLDEKNLLFPEIRGNHEARNLRNILENNQVSLVFVVPKRFEVMRVTGYAQLSTDPSLMDLLTDSGMPPKLCIKIEIKECFLHCGRALNLSHLWRPEEWREPNMNYRKRVRKANGDIEYVDIASKEQAELRKKTRDLQLKGIDIRD